MIARKEYIMNKEYVYKSAFGGYIANFLKLKKASGCSILYYENVFKELDVFAQKEGFYEGPVTEEFIKAWKQSISNVSKRTQYVKTTYVVQLLKMMVRHGCKCFIPVLPKDESKKYQPYIFTHEQIDQIFKAADNLKRITTKLNNSALLIPALFRLLYCAGLRISEALSLRNRDFDQDNRTIFIETSKNGSQRVIPLSNSMFNVLREYVIYRDRMPLKDVSSPDRLLFIKGNGEHVRITEIYNTFRKLLIKCHIPHLGKGKGPRLHDLRHTFAVHSLIKLCKDHIDLYTSLPIISAYLGHKSLRATERYVRLTAMMYPEINKQNYNVSEFIYSDITINNDENKH
jgi:integrase